MTYYRVSKSAVSWRRVLLALTSKDENLCFILHGRTHHIKRKDKFRTGRAADSAEPLVKHWNVPTERDETWGSIMAHRGAHIPQEDVTSRG